MTKKIIVAKYGGFCFGVQKAVNLALNTAMTQDKNTPLYSLGPLIHNEEVADMLASKGVSVLDSFEDTYNANVIIRSHGVAKSIYDEAQQKSIKLIDATCVYVKKVHQIVKKYADKGYFIVILGDENHPEVVGIRGWCQHSIVIDSLEKIDWINTKQMLCVVAQTTFNIRLWQRITSVICDRFKEAVCFNTICSATEKRQDEAREIAEKVDFMIVIGGKKSSNTRKLYEISKKICKKAQLIQKYSEINVKLIQKYDIIGIVAGASTPDWVIQEVIQKLKCEGEVVFNGKQ